MRNIENRKNNRSCSVFDMTSLFLFQETDLHVLNICHHYRKAKEEAYHLWNCDFHDTINKLKKK